jgi:hypothetical protein
LYLHSLEFLVSCERFGRNFGYLILFQAAKRDKFVKRKEEKKTKKQKRKRLFQSGISLADKSDKVFTREWPADDQ